MKKVLWLILTLSFFSGLAYSDITWSAPVTISTEGSNSSEPTVVIDSNGNVTAVWVQNSIIIASSLPNGGSWSSPVELSNVSNTASNPLLGLDSSGNATALWIESTRIESATLPFGGSWSAETSSLSSSGASIPALAVDAGGNAVAVWVRNGYIESSTRISGTWSSVAVLSAANASNPDVAISSYGTAMAVWQTLVSGADTIVSDILTISDNTWAPSLNVFSITTSFFHNYPKVLLDMSGNATVACFRYNYLNEVSYQNVRVISFSLPQGSVAWTPMPLFLSNCGIRNPADLTIQLICDTGGDVLAVWTNSYDGETFSIESAQLPFGGSWQSSVRPQSPSLYSFGINLTAASDIALLASMAWDGVSNITIQTQESAIPNPIMQGWTMPNQMSSGPDNGYPQCGISLTGTTFNAVIVWIYYNGSNTVINASTGTDTMLTPPSNVSVTQSVTDFGVYNDYCNTITWDVSPEPNVIQYNIFRNGVFFTGVDFSTLECIDHNQTDGETVTYGVAALFSGFFQSPIVTYTLFP